MEGRQGDMMAKSMIINIIKHSENFGELGKDLKKEAENSLNFLLRYIELEDESERLLTEYKNSPGEETSRKLMLFMDMFNVEYPKAKNGYRESSKKTRIISEIIAGKH